MKRTWIGAAVAGITTIAVTGLALAQEKQDLKTPDTRQMEKAQPAQGAKGDRSTEPGAGQSLGLRSASRPKDAALDNGAHLGDRELARDVTERAEENAALAVPPLPHDRHDNALCPGRVHA
jgi:hypothetical protein